jgi:hypothetical protein
VNRRFVADGLNVRNRIVTLVKMKKAALSE